jgi:hypothetical protein
VTGRVCAGEARELRSSGISISDVKRNGPKKKVYGPVGPSFVVSVVGNGGRSS